MRKIGIRKKRETVEREKAAKRKMGVFQVTTRISIVTVKHDFSVNTDL